MASIQVAIPNLISGNTALLKHATNVTGCAIIIETIFKESGFPKHTFKTLLTNHKDIEVLIKEPKLKAVTLTGSERAGKSVAKNTAEQLKKKF